jgi:hypothetical protein
MPDLHDDSLKIAKYLYDNKCTGEKSIVASQLREAVNLPSSDFDPADQYLLGIGYVHGTMGGEAGQRWLEPRGIEFVKSKLSHAQQRPAQMHFPPAPIMFRACVWYSANQRKGGSRGKTSNQTFVSGAHFLFISNVN